MTLAEMAALPQPLSPSDRRLVLAALLRSMEELGSIYLEFEREVRRKPLLGGVFGFGKYQLASHCIVVNGLDRVRYFVIEESSWLLIGCGESKDKALTQAREFLSLADVGTLAVYVGDLQRRRAEEAAEQRRLYQESLAESRAAKCKTAGTVRSIPRRRKQIFDASEGLCHYCSTPLTLDGKWHIEHKMPKALMGSNEPSNLVASCVKCNHQKRDLTDVEFAAKRGAA